MNKLKGLIIINLALSFSLQSVGAEVAQLAQVPAGKVEAIWLSPLSTKESLLKKNNQKKISPTKASKKSFVHVQSFKAMINPVTAFEFRKFLEKNPEWSKTQVSALYSDSFYIKDIDTADAQSPVTYVTWYAARAYCHSLGMRLPTVNEWEYMAAASETKKNGNRDEKFLKRILEWYGEPQGEKLKPVGSIYKNMYGLWDLHGLIWEWVEDFNSSFVTGESREDGSLNKDMFCGAGGMSSSDKENYAAYMRFAFRSSLSGKSSVWNLGFRCVK